MEDRFQQIKRKYVLSFEQKQKDLQQAWRQQDIEKLLHLLHKLAGSSGGYGYPRISQTCQMIKEHLVVPDKLNDKIVEGLLDSIYIDFQSELELINFKQ